MAVTSVYVSGVVVWMLDILICQSAAVIEYHMTCYHARHVNRWMNFNFIKLQELAFLPHFRLANGSEAQSESFGEI